MKTILLVTCALGLLVLPASAARLPVLASHDWWPVFSPNGRWVAFTNVNGQGRVFLLEVVDTATHRVTTLAQGSYQLLPSWSPDSTRVAYQSAGRIWTIGVDGRGRREVHAGGAPAWSSIGTVAYVVAGTVRAGSQSLATQVIGQPSWSPDGRALAFARADGIHVVTLDGVERKVASSVREPRSVAWSPDGGRIAFADAAAVFVAPADGAGAPQRVAGPFADVGPLSWAPAGDALAYSVRGGVELTMLDGVPHSSRLAAATGAGTSFAPTDPHGNVLAYAGPNPRCAGHDAIRLVDDAVLAGSCEIDGTPAADVIEGTTSGGDVIVAGTGNDRVHARNGHQDQVDCGPGRDVVWADRTDRLTRCELVRR
jgi:dipeptidyl aminopeptidase/acylaminoacyl peptidase